MDCNYPMAYNTTTHHIVPLLTTFAECWTTIAEISWRFVTFNTKQWLRPLCGSVNTNTSSSILCATKAKGSRRNRWYASATRPNKPREGYTDLFGTVAVRHIVGIWYSSIDRASSPSIKCIAVRMSACKRGVDGTHMRGEIYACSNVLDRKR